MTPSHALIQLLKLDPLNRDDIIKYTSWSEEKTARTIEICLFNSQIEWRHKPSRYVPAVRNQKSITELQRLSANLPTMRVSRNTRIATHGHRPSAENSTAHELATALGQLWTQRSGITQIGENLG